MDSFKNNLNLLSEKKNRYLHLLTKPLLGNSTIDPPLSTMEMLPSTKMNDKSEPSKIVTSVPVPFKTSKVITASIGKHSKTITAPSGNSTIDPPLSTMKMLPSTKMNDKSEPPKIITSVPVPFKTSKVVTASVGKHSKTITVPFLEKIPKKLETLGNKFKLSAAETKSKLLESEVQHSKPGDEVDEDKHLPLIDKQPSHVIQIVKNSVRFCVKFHIR
jgi:hypothetical protein